MLKDRIQAWSSSPSPILRTLARSLRALGSARRFLYNPRIRSEKLTRAINSDSHFQGATYTAADRYPELFAAAQRILRHIPTPAILSFGCATGEEAFSLSQYLPQATITGVDINRWCIRQAIASNQNPNLTFLHRLSPQFAALGPFDAIFCMAVFQRTENRINDTDTTQGNFTFDKFQQEITLLDSKLKPGGLFFIDHADFNFDDTTVAEHYTPLEFEGNRILHERPLFGPDNKLLTRKYTLPRAFQKSL